MFMKPVSIAVGMALMVAGAQAATLTNVEGAVFVYRDGSFQQVNAGADLRPLDRVRTGAGSADIVYEDGCASRVGPNQLVVVLTAPPAYCGGGGLKDGPVPGPVAGPAGDPPINGTAILAFPYLTGLAIALANGNNNNNPASP